MGKFTQLMGKFTQLLPILCDDCANIKMQQKTTHLHRYHASIVIKNLRAMNFSPDKIAAQFALFSEKFTRLTRILHDRRSHWSHQISTLVCLPLDIALSCGKSVSLLIVC